MRFATKQEIEYLSNNDTMAGRDDKLIYDLARRLDALRRYDQHFCVADWRPRPPRYAWAPNDDLAQP
jgi:hypothetical protein